MTKHFRSVKCFVDYLTKLGRCSVDAADRRGGAEHF